MFSTRIEANRIKMFGVLTVNDCLSFALFFPYPKPPLVFSLIRHGSCGQHTNTFANLSVSLSLSLSLSIYLSLSSSLTPARPKFKDVCVHKRVQQARNVNTALQQQKEKEKSQKQRKANAQRWGVHQTGHSLTTYEWIY